MIRVGFVLEALNQGWLGGVNYYRNLLGAIEALPERSIEPVIFTGVAAPKAILDGFPQNALVRTSLLEPRSARGLYRRALRKLGAGDAALKGLLRKHRIDVLSHHGPLAGLPTIGWIPDFQHLHLTGYFSEKELRLRDRKFHELCHQCTRILVSSFDAQKNLSSFNQEGAGKSRVLQFVPFVDYDPADLPGLSALEQKYQFKGPYLHLPNQFWIHKNHRVVVDALELLRASGIRPMVIATGHTEDPRDPSHFSSILDRIERAGVSDEFKVLGVVPYKDLVALMHHSKAVINPSLYEGWSTPVEEAKALGKRIILSDIPVHREQAPAAGLYFDPHSPAALAAVLGRVWDESDDALGPSFVRQAKDDWQKRRRAFASAYQEIVREIALR
jgi:glycosyltransferase involved in cell wall biosynthesis